MLQHKLEQCGLTKEEAQVYLTVLELGGAFASAIARKSGVARVNSYYILDKLRKKGLITANLKGKTKFFVAEPPQVLVNQMEERFQQAKGLLPELLSLTQTHGFKPVIRSYEGRQGIKSLFDQTLEAQEEILGYTNLESLGKLLPDYLPEYNQKLVHRRIKTRFLSPSTELARQYVEKFYPYSYPPELIEILFVNPKEFAFENHISIYQNRVAIISLNPDELIGVLMESPVYAQTQRAIFNLSWLGATAFVAQ